MHIKMKQSVLIILVLQFQFSSIIVGIPQIFFQDSGEPSGLNLNRRPLSQNTSKGSKQVQTTSTVKGDANTLRKLCPTLAENLIRFYRYDRNSRKCYRGGDQGSCGKNMIFYSEENSRVYGACDCDYKNQDRELIYHDETKQCYFVYSQGYCAAGKWLLFNQQLEPICASNSCYNKQASSRSTSESVPFRGSCVRLGTHHQSCGEGKAVGFVRGELQPKCTLPKNPGFTTLTVTVPTLGCTPGSVLGVFGTCRRKYTVKLN